MGATLGRPRIIAQSKRQLGRSELPSREVLEYIYAKTVRLPDRDERQARRLSQLGRAYHALYEKEGDGTDLEKAISLHETTLQCMGPFHPQLTEDADRLSVTLIHRFQQGGNIVDIERAILYLQKALNLTEDANMMKPGNLGTAFGLRFELLGDLSDMENAVLYQHQAVSMTADGDPVDSRRRCTEGRTGSI